MDPKDQQFPNSPPKSSAAPSSSSIKEEPVPSFMGTEHFAAEFSPLMEFEAFIGMTQPLSTEAVATGVPQPLERLQGSPIPPFLSKTFDLVDDRSLDSIISWGQTGESFVVWDPVEFSRLILPRNFKHNNLSSFVRQLNTYGFRKVDTDKWEFANEAFQRGKRHLLKNIQRRKSLQSQQVVSYFGSPTEGGRSGMEGEVERLRKEKSRLMQEVVELQQQHRGTAHHVEVVNQRLQEAEQRQKQMVSFLAKLFQTPSFLERLRQKKGQGEIGSPRTRRKFVKNQPDEPGKSASSMEGQIVKYKHGWRNLTEPSLGSELNPVPPDQTPYFLLQSNTGMELGAEGMPFQVRTETSMSDELAMVHGFIKTSEQVGEGASGLVSENPQLKGKDVMVSEQEVNPNPNYFVSFPEELAKEKTPQGFCHGVGVGISGQEDIWRMEFNPAAGTSSTSPELWTNLANYEVPELELMGGFPDIWDLSSIQVAEGSGSDKRTADDSTLNQPGSHSDQPEDDRSKKIDP